jgi:hypothetical protein
MEGRVTRRKPRTLRDTSGLTGRVNIRKTDEDVWLKEGLYNQKRESYHTSSTVSNKVITTKWADPAMKQYKFWNREESTEKGKFSYLLEISPESMKREARILSLSGPNDAANTALHDGPLPMGASVLGVGESLADLEAYRNSKPNVLFVSPSCPKAMVQLPLVLAAFPSIEWVHVRSAGIDFVVSDELSEFKNKVEVTNAKGQFSSSLAEYVSATRKNYVSRTKVCWGI